MKPDVTAKDWLCTSVSTMRSQDTDCPSEDVAQATYTCLAARVST